MKRRTFLTATTGCGTLAISGCLSRLPGFGLEAAFETTDPELDTAHPPDITVDGDTIIVLGTIEYGSSECGTAELAHAEYEQSQSRLDLLVVAADDSSGIVSRSCSDDLVQTGYRIEVTAPDDLRRVVATEHHLSGDAYSTTESDLD